jgi:dTDP-glucose pyrophosphorylase
MTGGVRKAVLLARGLGTRMRRAEGGVALEAAQEAAAASGLKAMIPAGGRPFLDHVLSAVADAGVSEACLVVGPEHEAVRSHYAVAVPRRLRISFAVQERPLGTADALRSAEAFAAGEDVLVLNGDNRYPVSALRRLLELPGAAVALFTPRGLVRDGNVTAERIPAFAVGLLDDEGFLADVVEKPSPALLARLGESVLVSMNCWRLPPAIFEACRRVGPSPRGELELPDAVRIAIRELGVRLRVVRCNEGVLDLSRRGDIATVTALLAGVEVSV